TLQPPSNGNTTIASNARGMPDRMPIMPTLHDRRSVHCSLTFPAFESATIWSEFASAQRHNQAKRCGRPALVARADPLCKQRVKSSSVRFANKDEGCPCHNRGAGTHERNINVLHLPRSGTTRRLQRAFDDMPQTVYAAGSEAATKRVER